MKPGTRRYLYGIATAGGLLAMAYGLIDGNTAPLWLGLVGAVLGNGLAIANVDTTKPADTGRHVQEDA